MIRLNVVVLAILLGCGDRDHSKDPWLQHVPERWTLTPAGHRRDAGPFGSVEQNWATEAEIDAAVDVAFANFGAVFPAWSVDLPVTVNDDYVMWVGQWAAGVYVAGSGRVGVTLWTRTETLADPGPAWIVRAPGNSWGVEYANWRHTTRPLVPALEHELLHVVIGDPGHARPEWAALSGHPRMKGGERGGQSVACNSSF